MAVETQLDVRAPDRPGPRVDKVEAGIRTSHRWRWLVLLSPTLLALLYYCVLASDRYEAEAQFTVRTASKPMVSTGFANILQMVGLNRSSDDVFSVQTYIESRDMVRQLAEKVPLREIYGKASWFDIVARYPSPIYGSSMEDLHKYLGWMVTTVYRSSTGLTTLNVQAFDPADAKLIAQRVLELSEAHVNNINKRIHDDAVRLAVDEVRRHEERLISAQVEITKFRNSELMLDAASSSILVMELIAGLSAELARVQAQSREMSLGAVNNPALAGLRTRAAALEEQILVERQKIASGSGGLAQKLAVFERLALEREFAKKALEVAVKSLEQAQAETRRQQLYLVRVVEPLEADTSTQPERLRMLATILALNLIGGLVGWLLWAGVREHGGTA
jgi:capsular polysaccharide transport system permease protein